MVLKLRYRPEMKWISAIVTSVVLFCSTRTQKATFTTWRILWNVHMQTGYLHFFLLDRLSCLMRYIWKFTSQSDSQSETESEAVRIHHVPFSFNIDFGNMRHWLIGFNHPETAWRFWCWYRCGHESEIWRSPFLWWSTCRIFFLQRSLQKTDSGSNGRCNKVNILLTLAVDYSPKLHFI